MANYSDLALVDLIKNGDRKAFNTLFQKYAPNLINQLKSNNQISSDSAEDIILESFLDVYKSITEKKYNEKGLFSAYVYTIAHRRFLKELNTIKEDSTDKPIDSPCADDSDREKYQIAAENAMQSLSDLCKDLIYYKNYHNFRDDEILENFPELNSVRNVKNRRNKCMGTLREQAESNLTEVMV